MTSIIDLSLSPTHPYDFYSHMFSINRIIYSLKAPKIDSSNLSLPFQPVFKTALLILLQLPPHLLLYSHAEEQSGAFFILFSKYPSSTSSSFLSTKCTHEVHVPNGAWRDDTSILVSSDPLEDLSGVVHVLSLYTLTASSVELLSAHPSCT